MTSKAVLISRESFNVLLRLLTKLQNIYGLTGTAQLLNCLLKGYFLSVFIRHDKSTAIAFALGGV